MSYQIADEPSETSLSAYACRPNAPLLAMMMAGSWLAWPWFIFNSLALGSPTKKKEITLCLVAIAGTAALGWVVLELLGAGIIRIGAPFKLCVLLISVWKLAFAYWVSTIQGRSFHVYEYYGGTVKNSAPVVSAGYYLRGIIFALSDDPLWIIIVAVYPLKFLLGGAW
jgi:hypothetical protein